MKKTIFNATFASLLGLALVFSSCSYNQFGAVTAGSSLGGALGSSIGGLMGGPRGSDKGTIAGMVIGGTIGAVATSPKLHQKVQQSRQENRSSDYDDAYTSSNSNSVQFDTYNSPRYTQPAAANSDLAALMVENVHFLDENNNHRLDYNEKAYLVFDIYNRGSKTLFNVAPNITCDSKRVVISAAASVASVMPNQGIRYKAAVVAVRRLKNQPLTFTISFGSGSQTVVAKTIKI